MSKDDKKCIADLLKFLDISPTAWHAVSNCASELRERGFLELNEKDAWVIHPGNAYFVTRNGSSLCAFVIPKKKPQSVRLVASHTDSPSFKLKPNAEFYKENMLMLGLEIYGAPMINSWLNRDLGIAGRVVFRNKKGKVEEAIVRIDDMPIVIPQLAIHLDRTVNESGVVLNKQEHLAALAAVGEKTSDGSTFLERTIKRVISFDKLLSTELYVFPLEPARHFGEHQELIASYRIDNLASAHASLHGILKAKADDHTIKIAAFWDNEEIGSNTAQGAGSPFIPNMIERISLSLKLSREDYLRLIPNSLCASVDLSHAVHPNYSDKHEPRHPVLLNMGIVIKTNAQHRYATDALSSATIVNLCHDHEIKFQHHISRGDMSCGSTVGPIHANLTGMPTVDIGCPQLSMHSAREIMGSSDHLSMCRLLQAFLSVNT